MAYNVKEYGVVSTDSADLTSVAAPTRDDYYPTMYEVKKEISKEINEAEPGGELSEVTTNTLVVPNAVVELGPNATAAQIAEAFGITEEELATLIDDITSGKYVNAVLQIDYKVGTTDNARYLPISLETQINGDNKSFSIEAYDENTYDNYFIQMGINEDGVISSNLGNQNSIIYPGVEELTVTSPATLNPNVFYNFGEAATVNVTFAEGFENMYTEYMFEFKSGAAAAVLTVPSTVKWVAEPNIEANKTYQVSILNNIGLIVGA